jgi:protein ImuB
MSRTERNAKLDELARTLSAFSPIVAFDSPFVSSRSSSSDLSKKTQTKGNDSAALFLGCNLDVSGCEKLFGGEVNLLRTLVRAISGTTASTGFFFHAAIAPTLGAAWALSRFGASRLTILNKNSLLHSLRPLPVAALRLEPELLASFSELNIHCIDELLKLGRNAILSRFGPQPLKRLDQAFGAEAEPLKPLTFPGMLRAEKIFSGPLLSLQALQLCAAKLLGLLLARLEKEHKKAAHLLLEVKTVQAPLTIKEVVFSDPTADERHCALLLASQVEQLNMGLGVESLRLSIFRTEEARAVTGEIAAPQHYRSSSNSLSPASLRNARGNLLDILGDHLGPEKILRVDYRASYIPEQSFSYRPLGDNHDSRCNAAAVVPEPNICRERPSLLFHTPSPAQAIAALPDSPPSWLKWRKQQYRIRCGIGPERISPEWWGDDPELFRTRDYFRIQLQSGTWLWIFRELETQRWFIQGIWC